MTLVEYVQSLQEAGETDISAKVAAWKINNPDPMDLVIEETEPVETEAAEPELIDPVSVSFD